jgi:hypothetical protein
MGLNQPPIQQAIDGKTLAHRIWIDWFVSVWRNKDTLDVYTVATLPTNISTGKLVFVSNETGGAVVAFYDGTNWRRVTDRAIVS